MLACNVGEDAAGLGAIGIGNYGVICNFIGNKQGVVHDKHIVFQPATHSCLNIA